MGIEAISITLLSPSPSSSYYIRIVCTLHFHQPTHSLARLRFLALGGIYLRYLQKFNFLPLSPLLVTVTFISTLVYFLWPL